MTSTLTEFDRVGFGTVEQPQIPGMEAVDTYSKLRVLGKPGVGKTTFLQHLAVQCSQRAFAPDQVPIFIALREFAEFRLNARGALASLPTFSRRFPPQAWPTQPP
jgi:predicted NACHT family NTPase